MTGAQPDLGTLTLRDVRLLGAERVNIAVHDGTIDAVATDHAPRSAADKQQDRCRAPFGMTGLEAALPVVADVLADVLRAAVRTAARKGSRTGG